MNTLDERQGETSLAAVIVDDAKFFYRIVGNSHIEIFDKPIALQKNDLIF